jgi:threonine aldolase
MLVDFRSDTVTKPTPPMLAFMLKAPVGDDVFEEDPTVNELEAYTAALFNMEAGLFCPSGTMSNQIAIKAHTQPGHEVICDESSHIYQYEGGGIAVNSLCSVKLLQGNRGRINALQVEQAINPNDIHKPITSLVSVENTCNRGGGSCYNFNEFIAIKEVCLKHNLQLHLDGARLMNAIVANKENTYAYGEVFNSISICLSKGLGAPVGSVLVGNTAFIKKARRIRKLMGGGMRQAGIIAAAGLYALQNHVSRLEEDHKNAKTIANCLQKKDFVKEILPVETNIIIATIEGRYTAQQLVKMLEEKYILMFAIAANQIRIVTHLNITPSQMEYTLKTIEAL